MYDDFISQEKTISKLKIELEELEQKLQDHKGLSNVILKQRQDLSYLLKEASYYMKEFEKTMPEDDFKKCEMAGKMAYEDWLKKEFEIDKVSVDVSLKS